MEPLGLFLYSLVRRRVVIIPSYEKYISAPNPQPKVDMTGGNLAGNARVWPKSPMMLRQLHDKCIS